jgi:hypothetical protein
VEALMEKEGHDETQFTTKIHGCSEFHLPPWMLMYFFFASFFYIRTLCMIKLRVPVLCFSYFADNSNDKRKRGWGSCKLRLVTEIKTFFVELA